ncbi:transglycosylase SLT domain-containing protein [Sporosarcina sp. SAFN-015]|uniref:transglycosylase SLT domain-containing protein n=1 Tax=Sporosarcina sp. SAFN-015 TaxID=3387274 RepID=UPI003F80888C
MKLHLFRVVVFTCLVIGLFSGQAHAEFTWTAKCEKYGDIEPNTNPSYQHMNCLLTNAALDAEIPPEVVKAVAAKESGGWKHFTENGEPIISADNGIGLMQITNQPSFNQERLKNDIYYNINAGIQILNDMYDRTATDLPSIKGAGRQVIENWYFPVMAYNGTKPVNSPIIQLTGARNIDAYQEKVFALIEKSSFLSSIKLAQFPFSPDDFQYDPNSNKNIDFLKKSYILPDTPHLSAYSLKRGDKVMVTTNVNIRPEPSTAKPGIMLPKDTVLIITGDFTYDLNTNSVNQFVWYPVKTTDGKVNDYYISSAYLTKLDEGLHYNNWEEKTNIDPHHNWTIHFTHELDETTVNDTNIYVQYDLQKIDSLKVSLLADQKSLKVEAPEGGYLNGETYFLYINKSVRSRNGQELKQPIKMKFTIKD